MSALPNKYVTVDYSTVGLSAILLEALQPNDTISSLWDRLSGDQRIRTFERFADAATLAFSGGLLILDGGVLRRTVPDLIS
ncbi:hypothetical protein LIHA111178_02085 [Litorimonas haliclonae]